MFGIYPPHIQSYKRSHSLHTLGFQKHCKHHSCYYKLHNEKQIYRWFCKNLKIVAIIYLCILVQRQLFDWLFHWQHYYWHKTLDDMIGIDSLHIQVYIQIHKICNQHHQRCCKDLIHFYTLNKNLILDFNWLHTKYINNKVPPGQSSLQTSKEKLLSSMAQCFWPPYPTSLIQL